MSDNHILIRAYRVGFGDCIYVQIPDGEDYFTMLIDCGSAATTSAKHSPIVDHLVANLPQRDGEKPRLDLIVATHPHADHIKGFDPEFFKEVTIGRVWMSAFMNPGHPQAKKIKALQDAMDNAANSLLNRTNLNLSLAAVELLKRGLSNKDALDALRNQKFQPVHAEPLYAARDAANHLKSNEEKQEQAVSFEDGLTCFKGFKEEGTCLKLLAPEWDIDRFYLGKATAALTAAADPSLQQVSAYNVEQEATPDVPVSKAAGGTGQTTVEAIQEPGNVSQRDFRILSHGMLYSGLAFSQDDDALKNNVSVVFLLEWRGKRLLFTGDAEWDGDGVKTGQRNSSWDVMLNQPKVSKVLLKTVDFLKVGHHGSINGSPSDQAILEQIVSPQRTQVVVSTVTGVHGETYRVPYPPLMKELGTLAANHKKYTEISEGEEELAGEFQPRRTDRESDSHEPRVDFVEVTVP